MNQAERDADWVICHDGTQGEMAYALECLRCGSIQKVALPINVDCYVAMSRAYGKQHSRCRLPKAKVESP